MLYVFLIATVKIFLYLFHRPRILGAKRNLKLRGGVIFIANHTSLLDPVMLAIACPRLIHFMAKKELFDTKLGNAVFRSLLVFPVNRRTADLKSLKRALELLKKGKAFGIFPEGRRSVTGELDDFEKGTAFIASKCDSPIVPVYISPSSYKGTRRLVMNVGECIAAEDVRRGLGERKLVDALTERMQNEMLWLQRETERFIAAKKLRGMRRREA